MDNRVGYVFQQTLFSILKLPLTTRKLLLSQSLPTFCKNGDSNFFHVGAGGIKGSVWCKEPARSLASTRRWVSLLRSNAFQGSLSHLRSLPFPRDWQWTYFQRALCLHTGPFLQIKVTNPIEIHPSKAQLPQETHIHRSGWGRLYHSASKRTVMPCTERFLLPSPGTGLKDKTLCLGPLWIHWTLMSWRTDTAISESKCKIFMTLDVDFTFRS